MRREKRAGVHDPTHDVYETVSLDRRRFLNQLGIAVLTVQCLSANALDSGDWHQGTTGAPDGLLIHSGPGAFSHEHDLLIPMAVIKTPPRQGVQREALSELAASQGGQVPQDWDTLFYLREIAAKLPAFTPTAIARATGFSESHCKRLRRGAQLARRHYWPALHTLVTEKLRQRE